MHRRGFLAGLLACPLCAQAAQASAAPHWDYDGARGADKWGDLDGAFRTCAIGGEQSPIDLKNAIPAQIDRLVLDWKPQAFEIVNTGHTIQANAMPGSGLQIGAERYELRQFHFHTPSEHALNGARSAMEVHFLHAHPSDRFAAVGAFLTSGGNNAAFTQIIRAAPTREGSANLEQPLDPTTLVPAEGALYRYEGSLSTPPCSETVEWNVFGLPVAVAGADIAAFRKLYPNNARPRQPVNRRFILQRD
jgi:carbonic anhydrase